MGERNSTSLLIRQRAEQSVGIRVLGIAVDMLERAVFHDLTCVDDRDLIADLGDNAQIMRDHDHGGIIFFLQILHEFEYLRLNGHIQRGSRLISNQQLGIAGQRHRNDHALLHAAGKLVRVLKRSAGMRTVSSMRIASSFAACLEMRLWLRIASAIWSATVMVGFSAVMGS